VERCSRELLASYGEGSRKKQPADDSDLAIPARTKELEVELISQALQLAKGNKTRAAALLDITRQGLLKKLKRYEL
jgi:DNA-binding protein Fis